jgi:hypothetical protein
LRQFSAGLFRYHVFRVPIGPVRVSFAGAFLMLTMRGFRTAKRASQIACRTERCRRRIDSAWKSRRDFLE